jgi:hypothetical protein
VPCFNDMSDIPGRFGSHLLRAGREAVEAPSACRLPCKQSGRSRSARRRRHLCRFWGAVQCCDRAGTLPLLSPDAHLAAPGSPPCSARTRGSERRTPLGRCCLCNAESNRGARNARGSAAQPAPDTGTARSLRRGGPRPQTSALATFRWGGIRAGAPHRLRI